MKMVGIIGGMSYESSTHYYGGINAEVNRRLGGLEAAKMIMYSVNFGEIEPLMKANNWQEIERIVLDIAKKLESMGVDFIVIASNTIHKVYDVVQKNIQIPVLHIADTVIKQCQQQKIHKVGLLGTAYTMQEDFLKERLQKNGLEVVVPTDKEEIKEIDRIIFEELCKGIFKKTSKEYYQKIVQELIDKEHIEGIILGCTEIEMLLSDDDVSIPVFDTAAAHITGIVEEIVKD